ncbi:MAG: ATP-grasp domain-containing protein [Chloroflexi bacterium]|nr:ATP-grasp domain-containing protein [Chloroflexota bacterium]
MVFVTDALLRKCVVVCHALSTRGIDVAIGDTTRLSPGFFSRHGRRYLVYPPPDEAPEAFVEALITYLRRRPHAMLLPVDDATIAVSARFRDDLERVTRVPLPRTDQLQYGLDKAPLMQLASRLGIPHPRTVLPASLEEVLPLSRGLRFPLVVKPRASSAGRGIAYVAAREDLVGAWEVAHGAYPLPMVQECVPNGRKFGVGLLMDHNGRCVASFVQEELRHFPLRDGMSTLQVSVLRPDLVERAVSLLRTIGWHGLAEVEFMEHPDTGEMLLLEVNPRIWASIQLAVTCGVNFPYLLHQLATGRPFEEAHTYVVGRQCRWLLPGDILHFLANSDRMRMQPSFFEFSGRETVYDGLYRDDLGATFGVLVSSAHYLFDPQMWRMLLRGRPATQFGQRSSTAVAA